MIQLNTNQCRKLILQDQLSEDDIYTCLAPVGFEDWQAAYESLRRIPKDEAAQIALAGGLSHLLGALADVPTPDQALINFERLIRNAPHQTEILQHLADNPRTIEVLVTLFTGSQFLTDILLRYPEHIEKLTQYKRLIQPKTVEQLYKTALDIVHPFITENKPEGFQKPLWSADNPQIIMALDALRRFQRWELLRIGTADLLGAFDLITVTSQISYLTDSILQVCLELVALQTDTSMDNFIVIAMGKLGGSELNYSSDIDLLFIVQEEPRSYTRLGQALIDALARVTAEGFLYRVDMRLRPWGKSGALVSSLDGYLRYLEQHARLWEKQALLKARPVAGNLTLGREFLQRIQPLIFGTPPEIIRAEVHALKQRIEAQLHQRGREWGEVKLGQGSIRDIEFITQYLQLAHGGKRPEIRSHNTLEALSKLFNSKFITPEEHRVLTNGYTFLRIVEHHLQLMHYQQTHSLPTEPAALNHLAHRLGFQGKGVGGRFVNQYQQHTTVIRVVYQQQLGSPSSPPLSHPNGAVVHIPLPGLLPHLVQMHASYVTTFSDIDIEHHAELVLQLDEDTPVKVEAVPLDDGFWRVTIIGYDYIGELSIISGLLFVYGFNIVDGHVFSYESSTSTTSTSPKQNRRRRHRPSWASKQTAKSNRRKIVDVFTVIPMSEQVDPDCWEQYSDDLVKLVRYLQAGEQHVAQGELAKRVAIVLRNMPSNQDTTLYPVDIEIDNDAARRHTVLRISAPDTIGFLYEFANALALHNTNISRVSVGTSGNRVQDTLYVTDAYHKKITDPDKQRELRVAAALIKHFTHLLPRSPDPELALLHFREFVAHLFTRPNWTDELISLERPEVLSTLARLLGMSGFLWDDFLRMQHENLFPVVKDVTGLAVGKTKEQLREALEIILQAQASEAEALNTFKDREMFRIDMRQIQGHITELQEFSNELTDLAEITVEAACRIALKEQRTLFGLPRLANGHSCPMVICMLGKAGGREMGFGSDIELMFVYAGNGRTTGPRVTTTAEFYDRLVARVRDTITTKQEGIFEIDLQLRPYGKAGALAVSLELFERYFTPDGEAWPYERQALVKLRPVAGDVKFGKQVVKLRDRLVYTGEPFDVAAMRAMRERQVRHQVTAGTFNAKSSWGGLVDIEYLIQALQITYGHQDENLRPTNTREAMKVLNTTGIIPNEDYRLLLEAFNFLQRLINALRMVRGNTKDLTVPPADSEEFAFLTRRLSGVDNVAQLQADLTRHTTVVQEINGRLLAY